jgi:Rne/Rng family ribonuclease
MANELIINATPQETRVALLEDRVLAEIYIERTKDRGIVGNIYKGKVVKVLPGMQAAFVDVGLGKAAFLYVSDVYGRVEDYEEIGFQGEEMPTVVNPTLPIEELLSPWHQRDPYHLPYLTPGAIPRLHAHRGSRRHLKKNQRRKGAQEVAGNGPGDETTRQRFYCQDSE